MTGEVVDFAAARARGLQRAARRRAMPRDPDAALTDAAQLVLRAESRAAEAQRDAREALNLMRVVHDYLSRTDNEEAR